MRHRGDDRARIAQGRVYGGKHAHNTWLTFSLRRQPRPLPRLVSAKPRAGEYTVPHTDECDVSSSLLPLPDENKIKLK